MKKRNIYQNQSQEIVNLFEAAGSNEKIMCVPMDYAKKDHLVMFCNGHGDILRKPFSVKNTPEGIAYIDDQVMRSCRRRGIKRSMSSLVVKMPIHLPKTLSVRYEAKVFLLPMLMRMTPKSSVGMCKPAPTE